MLHKTLKPQNFIHGEVKRTYFYNPLSFRIALMSFEKNSINHSTNMLIIGISKNTQWEIILGSLLHKTPKPYYYFYSRRGKRKLTFTTRFPQNSINQSSEQRKARNKIRNENSLPVSFGERASNKIVKLDRFKVAISR